MERHRARGIELIFPKKFLLPQNYFGIVPGLRRETVGARANTLNSRWSPVQKDWSAWLPAAKAEAFDSCVRQLEISYHMFSVSLNEALELRRIGKAGHSCRVILSMPPLCARFAFPLEVLLRTLPEHAKHFGVVPNTARLDAANFRGYREQRTALMSDLLSIVLLTQRSQFLHKIDTLEDMVLSIRKSFQEIASGLGSGESAEPSEDWRAIDEANFALNTWFGGSICIFQVFLRVIPYDQSRPFRRNINGQPAAQH